MSQLPDNLEAYLGRYGRLLAQQAGGAANPLHTPGKDEVIDTSALARQLLPAQQHVVTAVHRAWQRQQGVIFSGACGVGKTTCAVAAAHISGGGVYRAIAFCPPHLVGKWEREVRATLGSDHCRVHQLRSYRQLSKLRRWHKPNTAEWWIVSNTMAKLGSSWSPAVAKTREIEAVTNEPWYRCPDCGVRIEQESRERGLLEPITLEAMSKRRHSCGNCGNQLWQWTHKLDRWPIANYIHKRLRGAFDSAIIDESHQAAADNTLIGGAFGALCAAARRAICLTGTLMDGRAIDLKATLLRIAPRSLIAEGITWSGDTEFNQRYGRIDSTVITTERIATRRDRVDCYFGYGARTTTKRRVQPGVMPSLFSRHLIQNIVFLNLDEVADDLPDYDERVIPVAMDDEQATAYSQVEAVLRDTVKTMMARKDRRLLSAMIHALLGYPDYLEDYGEIGYYDVNQHTGERAWNHVITPPSLALETIRPKEQIILDTVLQERSDGRKCWVYVQMTDKRDVVSRLERIFAAAGLTVAVLRAKVPTKIREEWMAQRAPYADVMISHPKLVETGVDFFGANRAYNIPTILWYQTGYSCKTLRQASSRHIRIGQWQPCRTCYFFYEETMQARALKLMGDKIRAAESIEGKFSSTGLVALAGDEGSMELVLARSLVDQLGSDTDVGRSWEKVGAPKYTGPVPNGAVPARVPRKHPPASQPRQLGLF